MFDNIGDSWVWAGLQNEITHKQWFSTNPPAPKMNKTANVSVLFNIYQSNEW